MSLAQLLPGMHLQKTLNLHFGKLVVLVFFAEWSKQSVRFK
jgi:glutaredoxin-related protein